MVRAACLAFVLLSFAVEAPQGPATQPPTQAQQRPVFRGGTHFVRVDAYPTTKDGKIVEGLAAGDFAITEDGKPQTIESFDFISFPTFTPETERRDPVSQRAGYDTAADPRYRMFVILLDTEYVERCAKEVGGRSDLAVRMHNIQQPLAQFLDRVLGPMDLFGFLTTKNSAKDLVLGQKTTSVQAQIADLVRATMIERDPELEQLEVCGQCVESLKIRYSLDRTYVALESLVEQLGSLREERKNVIFVADDLPRVAPTLGFNGSSFPKAGITGGRVGIGDSGNLPGKDRFCTGEVERLAAMDFDQRYRELLKVAREQNVAFYTITPSGLQPLGGFRAEHAAPPTAARQFAVLRANENVSVLAHETDGIAIVDTNDLGGGMKRIADDLAAYYVLGYYTTNTTWDGGLRTIKVRLKSSGETIRARRQYRAPTQKEINDLAAKPAPATRGVARPPTDRETALAVLERSSRPFAAYTALNGTTLTVVTELTPSSIQNGRWKAGADIEIVASGAGGATLGSSRGKIEAGEYSAVVPLTIDAGKPPARISLTLMGKGERPANDWLNLVLPNGSLVGEPLAYRSASRIATRPIAAFEFARNERIRIEWPILAPSLDRREVRLLDHAGKPLPVEIPLSEDQARKSLTVDMSLSGLPHGDYLFDLTAGSGGATEDRLLAIRIK